MTFTRNQTLRAAHYISLWSHSNLSQIRKCSTQKVFSWLKRGQFFQSFNHATWTRHWTSQNNCSSSGILKQTKLSYDDMDIPFQFDIASFFPVEKNLREMTFTINSSQVTETICCYWTFCFSWFFTSSLLVKKRLVTFFD